MQLLTLHPTRTVLQEIEDIKSGKWDDRIQEQFQSKPLSEKRGKSAKPGPPVSSPTTPRRKSRRLTETMPIVPEDIAQLIPEPKEEPDTVQPVEEPEIIEIEEDKIGESLVENNNSWSNTHCEWDSRRS